MVIDTGLFIEHIRAKDKSKTTLFHLSDSTNLFISTVTLYELYAGATTDEKAKDLRLSTGHLKALAFNNETAIKAAQLYRELKQKNKLIEFRDIFIAATCIVNELPLATLNKKHFERINGLKLVKLI